MIQKKKFNMKKTNIFTTKISYPEKFSVLFNDSIKLIFFNNNIISLEDQKGISISGGGDARIFCNS